MALKNQVPNVYSVGLHNVGSYQVSGMPFAVSASMSITFPYVTSWVRITNEDNSAVKVGFSANGLSPGTNYFEVRGQTASEPLSLKLTELHFSKTTGVTVVAGLTNIPTQRINNLSSSNGPIFGPNWSGSVGVG